MDMEPPDFLASLLTKDGFSPYTYIYVYTLYAYVKRRSCQMRREYYVYIQCS